MNLPDPNVEQLVQPELMTGEKLLWAGKPSPWRHALLNISLPIFGLVLTAFGIFIYSQFTAQVLRSTSLGRPSSTGFSTMFQFIIFIFIGAGIGMSLSPIWRFIKALSLVYAITDQRALLIEKFPVNAVRAYSASDMSGLQRKGNEAQGDLIFAREVSYRRENDQVTQRRTTRRVITPIGFFGIANPRAVSEIMTRTFFSNRKA